MGREGERRQAEGEERESVQRGLDDRKAREARGSGTRHTQRQRYIKTHTQTERGT
jgi:hypothetical protein